MIKGLIVAVSSFAAGVGLGIFAAKRHYRDVANKEINDILKCYSKPEESETEEPEEEENEPDISPAKEKQEYTSILVNNYVNLDEEKDYSRPRIIDSREYAVYDDYDTIELTYYVKDGILADDRNFALVDVDRHVGKDNLKVFKKVPTPNEIYIYNEKEHTYYQICRCDERYEGPEKED